MLNKSVLGLLADPGNVILCYTKPIAVGGKAPPNIAEHFTSEEALLARATELAAQGRNLYFTPASFTSKTRTKSSAKGAHAIWFDVDIRDDKGYKTSAAAMAGIQSLIARFSLPTPTIISTGGGYHLYWVCEDQLFPAAWNQCAKALHAMVKAIGGDLASDTARITDMASMMRLPGFYNVTRGAIAQVVHKAPPITKAEFFRLFDPATVITSAPVQTFNIAARPAHLGGSAAPTSAPAPATQASSGFNIAARPAHLGGSAAPTSAPAHVPAASSGFNIAARPAHLGGSVTSAPVVAAASASAGMQFAFAAPVRNVAQHSAPTTPHTKVNPISDGTKSGTYPQLLVQCALMRHMAEHPNDVSEPEWKYALNVIMQTADGAQAAHEFSSGYATYDFDQTEAKIALASSFDRPASCSTLRGVSSVSHKCDGCALKNMQVSPVKGLGKIIIPALSDEQPALDRAKVVIEFQRSNTETDEARKAAAKSNSLPPWGTIPLSPFSGKPDANIVPPIPPKGFVYGHLALGQPGVYDTSNVAEPIMSALIWADREMKLINESGVSHVGYRFRHIDNRGVSKFLYVESTKMQPKEVASWMVSKGIVTEFTSDMFRYIIASVTQVHRASSVPPIYVVDSFGWIEVDDKLCFVTPASVVASDGYEMEVVSRFGTDFVPVVRNAAASAEAWAKGYALCNPPSASHAHFAVLCSLASVLYFIVSRHGDDVGGIVMALAGETGTGKSFLQNIMQSVWQTPSSASGMSTFNALPKLASISRHLLCAVDDLTMFEKEKEQQLFQFVLSYPQGKEKARADARNNLHQGGTWKNIMCITSNLDIGELVRQSDKQGGADARLLEINIRHRVHGSSPVDEEYGRAGMFIDNPGTLGIEFARRILTEGTETIADLCAESRAAIREAVGDKKADNARRVAENLPVVEGVVPLTSKKSSLEANRFRVHLIALAACAGIVMRDILPFDVDETIQWAVDSAAFGAFSDTIVGEDNPDRRARVGTVIKRVLGEAAQIAYELYLPSVGGEQVSLDQKLMTKRAAAADKNERNMRSGKPIQYIEVYDAFGMSSHMLIARREFERRCTPHSVGLATLDETLGKPKDGLPRVRSVNLSPLVGASGSFYRTDMVYISVDEYNSFDY